MTPDPPSAHLYPSDDLLSVVSPEEADQLWLDARRGPALTRHTHRLGLVHRELNTLETNAKLETCIQVLRCNGSCD